MSSRKEIITRYVDKKKLLWSLKNKGFEDYHLSRLDENKIIAMIRNMETLDGETDAFQTAARSISNNRWYFDTAIAKFSEHEDKLGSRAPFVQRSEYDPANYKQQKKRPIASSDCMQKLFTACCEMLLLVKNWNFAKQNFDLRRSLFISTKTSSFCCIILSPANIFFHPLVKLKTSAKLSALQLKGHTCSFTLEKTFL